MVMYEFLDYQVADAMTYRPLTVSPGTPLAEVDARYRSVPVTIGALLIGIVARQDVARALRRAAAGEGPKLRRTRPDCDRKPALAAPGRSQRVEEAVA